MFKRCLLISAVLHIVLFVGVGLYLTPVPPVITPPVLELVSATLTDSADLGGSGALSVQQTNPTKSGRGMSSPGLVLQTPIPSQPLKAEIRENGTGVNRQDSIISTEPISVQTKTASSGAGVSSSGDGSAGSGTSGITAKPGSNLANTSGNGTGTGGGPESTGMNFQAPQGKYNPKPSYPLIARRNNWEGTVALEVKIGKDGYIRKVMLIQSSGHQVLDNEAIKRVKTWHYIPATQDGKPIEWQLRIKIHFKLEE